MSETPEPIQNLVDAFSRLPGIGPKTASRLAFYLLNAPDDLSLRLADALNKLKASISFCEECFNITLTGNKICTICIDDRRDSSLICVVEKPIDILVLERLHSFNGKYHVLHGVLSPIEGIGPDDLRIRPLIDRVKTGLIHEVILATNPSMEGDATAQYIQKQLVPLGVHVTRLARGLPVGGELEYADQNTLLRAISGRQEMTN
jgi:recombination protein RecR